MREFVYPFDDGSVYKVRIVNGKLTHAYQHAPKDEMLEEHRIKLAEAYRFFLFANKITREEFDRLVNYDNYFNGIEI